MSITELPERNFKAGLITLAGITNVGKSTLVNRLVGQKISIISPKPQTTRHRIRGIVNRPNSQLVILDTPGLHNPKTALNRKMVKVALQSLHGTDLIALMIFPIRPTKQPGLFRLLNEIRKSVTFIKDGAQTSPPVILTINHIDTVAKPSLLPIIETMANEFPFTNIIPISALTGENVDRLVQTMEQELPISTPLFDRDMPSDRSEKFFIAELIREVILHKTQQEVPHASTVIVDQMTVDDDEQRLEIYATIVVERAGQKKILIGKAGENIKQIGIRARKEMETIFPYQVRLNLWIKVKPRWRDREHLLRSFGIEDL